MHLENVLLVLINTSSECVCVCVPSIMAYLPDAVVVVSVALTSGT